MKKTRRRVKQIIPILRKSDSGKTAGKRCLYSFLNVNFPSFSER